MSNTFATRTAFRKPGDSTSNNSWLLAGLWPNRPGNRTKKRNRSRTTVPLPRRIDRRGSTGNESTDQAMWLARIQDRVNNLVREYRVRGHLVADLDPLGLTRPDSPNLSPESYGLSDEDLNRPFDSTALEDVMGDTIESFLTRLAQHVLSQHRCAVHAHRRRMIRDWLQRRMETTENRLEMSHERQRRIYARLGRCVDLRRIRSSEIRRCKDVLARRCRESDSDAGFGAWKKPANTTSRKS